MADNNKNKPGTFKAARVTETVESLLKTCVRCVVNSLHHHIHSISTLPASLKGKVLQLVSKRGLITDENIQEVLYSNCRVLDLSECNISDRGLRSLALCRELKKLDLNSAKENRTDITTEGIEVIASSCPNLQVLYLRRCSNVTDDAVVRVAQCCRQLRELNIGGCKQIGDRSLESLGKHSMFLNCINFSKTCVTDRGVIALAMGRCSQALKEMHMDGCVSLTDEAVEGVMQFCPQISILIFHGCPNITDDARRVIEEHGGGQGTMKQLTWTIYC